VEQWNLAVGRKLPSLTGHNHNVISVAFAPGGKSLASGSVDGTVRLWDLPSGRVMQTIGLGPHRANLPNRPAWFFQRERYGGIITDIASHQVDQFLFFTGSISAEVVAAQVANYQHPEHSELEDFGDVLLRGNGGTGYIRVDWFTPDGLATWGDGRLTILGTDGYIELRKYIDIAGRPGTDHLFLMTQQKTEYIDCSQLELPYGRQLIDDIVNRTETAMPQAHCFLASELALTAQAQAARVGCLQP